MPDPSPLDLTDCEVQQKLTQKGREEARAIGGAFQTLKIPVGQVLSSAYCRTLETARLAFGRVDELSGVLLHQLYVPMPGVPVLPSLQERTEGLKQLLATPPTAGTNTVLVSHGETIRGAVGFELETSEAAIFKPDGRGGFTLLAQVLPNEWESR